MVWDGYIEYESIDMSIYALIPGVIFVAYFVLAIIALWSQSNKQRRVFYWYIFASLAWSASSVILNSDYLVTHKLAFCKLNIATFTWSAVQFYNFSRSYGYGKYTWSMGGAYMLLLLVITLAVLDFIPVSIVLGNGVSYGLGIWLVFFLVGLAALTVENIRAQVLALTRSSGPVQRKLSIFIITVIGIRVVFSLPSGFVTFSHLPIGHIGNFIAASLLTYVLVGFPHDRTE